MPRTCFVIMPFSATESCTEEEWTWIFEEVFKPAVEGAGLDYECRRSVATRGNIVAAILEDLRNAYVVLADLTDRNPNVFYELGVRHSLSDRSVILAQKRSDIPFDLQAYAYHVYNWRTEEGRTQLTQRLRELLTEVDANPGRPDNPVSDFLGQTALAIQAPEPARIAPSEVATAQPLAGPGAEGLDAARLAERLATSGAPNTINIVLRLTRGELNPAMKTVMETLNKLSHPAPVKTNEVPKLASKYIDTIEPLIEKVEQFILSCIELNWMPGTQLGLKFAGEWISLSERAQGTWVKFAKGLPTLLASRLLILMGAKSIADDAFKSLETLMREPIEVEELGGKFTHLTFAQRHELFHLETFLGNAVPTIQYVAGLQQKHPYLHAFFGSEEEYHLAVAEFLMLLTLDDARRDPKWPLYPGYRLIPQASRAKAKLCGRLRASPDYIANIAQVFGESPENFRQAWPKRAAQANRAELGSDFFPRQSVRFPANLGDEVEGW